MIQYEEYASQMIEAISTIKAGGPCPWCGTHAIAKHRHPDHCPYWGANLDHEDPQRFIEIETTLALINEVTGLATRLRREAEEEMVAIATERFDDDEEAILASMRRDAIDVDLEECDPEDLDPEIVQSILVEGNFGMAKEDAFGSFLRALGAGEVVVIECGDNPEDGEW